MPDRKLIKKAIKAPTKNNFVLNAGLPPMFPMKQAQPLSAPAATSDSGGGGGPISHPTTTGSGPPGVTSLQANIEP